MAIPAIIAARQIQVSSADDANIKAYTQAETCHRTEVRVVACAQNALEVEKFQSWYNIFSFVLTT